MKVVVDTSIVIDHLRITNVKAKTLLQEIRGSFEVVLSLVTVGELFGGQSSKSQENVIEEIFDFAEIIEPNFSLMKNAGIIRRETKIELLDAIIAATALNLNLPLATLNEKDFRKVKGLRLYKF